jgi:hypothetical protein
MRALLVIIALAVAGCGARAPKVDAPCAVQCGVEAAVCMASCLELELAECDE